MPLGDSVRRQDESPVTAGTLLQFQQDFAIFTENSLPDFDWSSCVVAGSAVTTCLQPLPSEVAGSKRATRKWYHEELAPESDIDIFLYGLDEEGALEKIKGIERHVRDSILQETTTIRTKNAITIVSQYPSRHIQIVLRLYKSISEILTGFDVDCSCVAYDGSNVWVTPRAIASFITQSNTIDLSRRSPSYENHLAKYARRGFEICWPSLDRSRIDPTIFERSFRTTQGLARLLILERLTTSNERDDYQNKRRSE